ncbi:MAG: ABC transporter ATP-binding protein [Clostridia bacterium]|nr:ABC transporter ATP-binding protein [Clostridia bacterium]
MRIELKNIVFSYEDNKILDNFNLEINEGECICLSGRSGCGKTTIARLILGLENSQSGTVIAPKHISCIFQEDRLLNHLTLKKNVYLPLSKEQYDLADCLIDELGLSKAKKSKAWQLSGGMKRRTSIAMAIAFAGEALILDEPFNGIDDANKQIAANIIKREFLDKGKPVLLISHISEDAQLLNAKNILI